MNINMVVFELLNFKEMNYNIFQEVQFEIFKYFLEKQLIFSNVISIIFNQ